MSTFFGVSSDSVGTLFSGLSTSSKTSNYAGSTNILSDYYSIKNGSYKKLLTAYYDKFGEDSKIDANSSTSTSADSTAKLSQAKSASGDLQESATNLLAKGSTSLFKEAETKDDKGNVTTGYNMDKIYDGIKSFADNYNKTLDVAGKSNVDSISRSASSMVSTTKSNSNLLKSVGITINNDNTLSVDKDKLKSADVSTLKSLFNTAGSYGYSIGTKASQINASATIEAAKTNTYTNTGSYSSLVSSGDLYDSLF